MNDELDAIIGNDANGGLGGEDWPRMGEEARDGELQLADVAEAVCRVSSPPEAEAADTDEAWARMSARIALSTAKREQRPTVHGRKKGRWRMRIAFMAVSAAAAAAVLAVLLAGPSATGLKEEQTAKVFETSGLTPKSPEPRAQSSNPKAQTSNLKSQSPKASAACTVTAATHGNLSNASQLVMELRSQGYAVDKHVQRTSQPVRPGELGRVALPDGTEAWLYASSKLTYPSAFVGERREVVLEGEAYFKVRHDASHPFVIHAGGVATRVLGTELDVRAYHGEPPHVALITGAAEVAAGGGVCRLRPGEGVTLHRGGLVRAAENMDVYTYALRGMLYADNEPLRDVLQRLARWYGMTVAGEGCDGMERRIHFFMRGADPPRQAASLLTGMGVCTVRVVGDRFVVE